ncbi:MAG: hypothetical protein IJ763_03385 [Lachnospiraceae bacterium]|nr:hypothetical protein [Lachnospiraceae bacterium]
MDENYLDGLLNSVSSDGKKNNVEESVEKDSGINIDMSDLDALSLDEFDDLGDLDGLDLGDLDFDDIDFDDIDITSLDSKALKASKEPEEEDFSLDDLLEEPEQEENFEPDPVSVPEPVASEPISEPEASENLEDFSLDEFMAEGDGVPAAEEVAALNDNNNDTSDDTSIEDLLSALEEPEASPVENAPDVSEGDTSSIDDMDLDDLFSALGIEDEDGGGDDADMAGIAANASIDSLDAELDNPEDFSGLEDIEYISEVKPDKGKKAKKKKEKSDKSSGDKEKKSLSQILFGEPEEEELEEEEQRRAKKAEKKEEKAKKKEENKEKKAEKLELKNNQNAAKKSQKADKKKQKADAAAAEAAAEAAEDAAAGNKPVSKPVTAIIFAVFAIGAVLVVLGTNSFSYRQVIKKATDYFERQRYRLAYDQVAGVDVKEKDQELKDRIYTVMYVERLYESYENNMNLNRPDKALDSLIRGLEKYDEHYDEAVELEIVDDINLCKANIIEALEVTFGLSEADAYMIMSYEGQDYIDALNLYSGAINIEE